MISHDYQLIFIHIPKCAGRSISEVFNQRFDQFIANHYYTEYYRFWNSYRKFTIVRNPYDRLVSMYNYIQQHRRHKGEPIGCNGAGFEKWVRSNISARQETPLHLEQPGFSTSPQGFRGTDGDLGSRHWFTCQRAFITTPIKKEDSITIFRFEDGMSGVEDFIAKSGPRVTIPHKNKSEHKPWQEYYTPRLLEFLSTKNIITIDCRIFGYDVL